MKKYILLLFLSHVCLITYAQLYAPQAETAEAAAVRRYATYPVDFSTGIPNISIPLYEIKVGDITLPITLSYHSSGMKPNEAGGRIAKGWTLNAEPSISKQIRGLDDACNEKGAKGLRNINFFDYEGTPGKEALLKNMLLKERQICTPIFSITGSPIRVALLLQTMEIIFSLNHVAISK